MDTLVTSEKQLLADIEHAREQCPNTQDLYREVCALLFFRYGMAPTANKLYQLVRKGSMSAPADALNKFWEDLREKSRVRIEHPDLPEALKTAAGELTATLWSTAQAAANESLASYRSEAQALVIDAKTALEAAEADRDGFRQALESVQHINAQANERISALEQQLAATVATNTALGAQLQQAKTENTQHQQHLEDARRDFTVELDKLRAAAELADERFNAIEKRALLEIDRERSAASKLQKELDVARTSAAQAQDRHRSEMSATQIKLGDLRQRIGMLEGSLLAVTANRDAVLNEIKAVQTQFSDTSIQLSLARTEADRWRQQEEQAQQLIAQLRVVTKPARKAKTE